MFSHFHISTFFSLFPVPPLIRLSILSIILAENQSQDFAVGRKKIPFSLNRNDSRSLVEQLVDGLREAIVANANYS